MPIKGVQALFFFASAAMTTRYSQELERACALRHCFLHHTSTAHTHVQAQHTHLHTLIRNYRLKYSSSRQNKKGGSEQERACFTGTQGDKAALSSYAVSVMASMTD